jgi:hypothetical protein
MKVFTLHLTILIVIQAIFSSVFAQTAKEEFKPNGKPLALIFTHFSTAFTDGKTNPEFGITRAYLGYEYSFSKEWNAKLILDVGDPKSGTVQFTAFLKNAYIEYKKKHFAGSFGVIATTQFKVAEKIWGLRYIEKSFQDAYSFNASADLGLSLDYRFADFISADFMLANGEGYKKMQKDSLLRPGLGITLNPVKTITARVYGDFMGRDVKQSSLATFAAYTGKKLMVAAEYNYQKNFAMKDGQDIYGTSFYTTFQATDKVKLFGRFDDLKSKPLEGKDDPWQLSRDGQLIIAGMEYNVLKGIKVAPNFRYWNPADESMPATSYAYLNFELRF